MKQGIRSTLAVKINNLSAKSVERIEFLFKASNDQASEPLKTSVYPGDVTLSRTDNNTFLVPFLPEETYRFQAGKTFYMDTKVYLKGMQDNPETPIMRIIMNKTLFGEGE